MFTRCFHCSSTAFLLLYGAGCATHTGLQGIECRSRRLQGASKTNGHLFSNIIYKRYNCAGRKMKFGKTKIMTTIS